jgi:multiple sugar transport system permease protein
MSKFSWVNTGDSREFLSLIVPWTASVFAIFLVRQHMKTVPLALEDAAKMDGCSGFKFLWHILIPLVKPALVAAGLFTFISSWNGFLWPLVMSSHDGVRPIQVGLAILNQAEGTRYELLMAAALISIIPLIILYFIAQKQIIESFTHSGMKD